MTHSPRVSDLPSQDRPRERLIAQGAGALSTAELLAILVATGQGTGKLSAVGLGQHILQVLGRHQQDSLTVLRHVTAQELMSIPGIGEAKASTILAAIELGRRVLHTRPPMGTVIDDPAIAAAILSNDLMWQPQERFAVLMLDIKHRVLGSQVLSVGTATETLAHPRDIFRAVIRHGATRVVVAHNHPSGSIEPSAEDLALTRQLLSGSDILGIPLLDHLILGNGNFVSLRQKTDLWD
ncbi:MAG: DNA repair protein RadC [Elainellaceae cyanobacterium]